AACPTSISPPPVICGWASGWNGNVALTASASRRFPHSPKRQRGDGFTGQTVPALRLRSCEKLARQAKPPAPPSLQTLGQQGRWGRRFRLPGRPEANFSHLLDAWGYLALKTEVLEFRPCSFCRPGLLLPCAVRGMIVALTSK